MSEPGRSSKAFTIREACGDDAAGMQQFLADLFAEKLPVVFRKDAPPTVDEERAVVEALAASPRSTFLIATVGPKVVGVLDFHGCTRALSTECYFSRPGASLAGRADRHRNGI